MTDVEAKTKEISVRWPNTTRSVTENEMSQSELEENVCNRRQARDIELQKSHCLLVVQLVIF